MKFQPEQYFLRDNGEFPNSRLPVLIYRKALTLPLLFPAVKMKSVFKKNGWTNNWKSGIYTYNHYHSTTHEVFGVCKGKTGLLLGGRQWYCGLHRERRYSDNSCRGSA